MTYNIHMKKYYEAYDSRYKTVHGPSYNGNHRLRSTFSYEYYMSFCRMIFIFINKTGVSSYNYNKEGFYYGFEIHY